MLSSTKKIAINMIYIILLLFIRSWIGYFVMATLLFLSALLVKMPIKNILNFIKKFYPIILFTVIVNMLFIENGKIIFSWSFIKITDLGVISAIKLAFRLFCIIFSSQVLTFSTPPLELAKGIENIMNPLKIFKFPVHELSMMISIALRFIPILEEELNKIIIAQKTRGALVNSKNLFKRIKFINSIIAPLIISIFRRSEQIAIAMESRCYKI